ncbi:uncharacterized protein isoform X2 [Rhodnius prolixus]|uniref:uncharacterized protein isoform X2 n=1 Tax=Rhodnius prolixus TaxID=13249 RepID=UPI003D18C1F0
MDSSHITLLFYFLLSGSALYTEVRKLSGNEYRDVHNLPVSSNNSVTFQGSRKTPFKWVPGNDTIGQTKTLALTNRTKIENKKKKINKGGIRWRTILRNSSNASYQGRINLLSKANMKNKRLKRKRDSKKTKRKRQKLKKEKKIKNEMLENNLTTSKEHKTSGFPQRPTSDFVTKKEQHSATHATLAEEPKKQDSAVRKYEAQSNVESLKHYSIGKSSPLIYELHDEANKRHRNKQHLEIIDKYDQHMSSFRSKWKEYAQRNFTSDLNECLLNNGGCEGLCINTPGSHRCHCPQGFRLDLTRKLCLDINECAARNGHGPCQGECMNTWGSFRCDCQNVKGTRLSDDKKSCIVIDACSTHNCSHVCINTRLGPYCSCPLGFVLGDDWVTCVDIDECQHEDLLGKCDEKKCENTLGSFKCI